MFVVLIIADDVKLTSALLVLDRLGNINNLLGFIGDGSYYRNDG